MKLPSYTSVVHPKVTSIALRHEGNHIWDSRLKEHAEPEDTPHHAAKLRPTTPHAYRSYLEQIFRHCWGRDY